jgi:hypothetical protein
MTQINIPVVNAAYLNVQGLELAVASNTTMTMALGQARNSTNVSDIVLSAAVTINAANNGINGLDTGALANVTLYSVYVVGDSSGNSASGAVLSASASAPLMPVGYDMFRKIGYVRTDGAAHFLAGYWSGSSNERKFMYDAPLATAVTAGAAVADAPVVLTGLVPAVAGLPVYVYSDLTPSAAGRSMSLKPFGATGFPVVLTGQVATVHVTSTDMVQAALDSGAPKLEYIWSAGGGDAVALSVAGYEYNI